VKAIITKTEKKYNKVNGTESMLMFFQRTRIRALNEYLGLAYYFPMVFEK